MRKALFALIMVSIVLSLNGQQNEMDDGLLGCDTLSYAKFKQLVRQYNRVMPTDWKVDTTEMIIMVKLYVTSKWFKSITGPKSYNKFIKNYSEKYMSLAC